MTDAEKIELIKGLLGDSTITSVMATPFLIEAKADIFTQMYPTGNRPSTVTEVPQEYEILQCKLASRYYSRMGAEGEIIHNENGINRTWDSVDDADLLCKIMQVIRV